MSDDRPLITERNARDLSPEMRAKYRVISDFPPSLEEQMQQFYREGQEGDIFALWLLRTAERREAEWQARRMARDLINDGHITPAQYVRILGGEPRKKPRYTPPPTRLDGRRKR